MEKTHADSIIAEVWAVRDGIAARSNYDVDVIFRRIREMQDESGRDYVTNPARRIIEGSDKFLAV